VNPQGLGWILLNLLELLSFEAPMLGVKRDDEVIRALAPGAGVLCLDGADDLQASSRR
jgi:hypothetical protein